MFVRALHAQFTDKNTPIFDIDGQAVLRDSLLRYNPDLFALREYMDCRGKIVRQEIVPIDNEDIELRRRIDSLYHSRIDLQIARIEFVESDSIKRREMIAIAMQNRPIELLEINCDSVLYYLSQSFQKDQERRNSSDRIQLSIDRQNVVLLVSVIERCGFDHIAQLGKQPVYHAFMVAQHASPEIRKKYFHYFEEMSQRSLLDWSSLALMIDRMLIESGKNQKYGTQFRLVHDTIYIRHVQDAVVLDSLRESMGLLPMHDYIHILREEFEVENVVIQ